MRKAQFGYGVLGVRARAAGTARAFLDELQARMPFPVRALQADGGSEFMAEFVAGCAERGIALFVLPPRSPKLKATSNGLTALRGESSGSATTGISICPLQTALPAWEHDYNHVWPHQALG